FVMPYEDGYEPVIEVFRRIVSSGQGSPLIVFKTFGDVESPGMMSFPRKGITLAIDFPFRGRETLRLLDDLDSIVMSNGGRLYPAKDARMSAETFRKSYPNWEAFAEYIDPAFSSSFWRRVTGSA
ncbi:MAG: FAD-binding protein, partial [Chloroflexota bacterium]